MQQSNIDVLLVVVRLFLTSWDVGVVICYTSYILHSSILEIWAEDLIELTEWVITTEELFVVFNADVSNLEPLSWVEVFHKRFSKINIHGNRATFIFICKLFIRPCTNGVKVSADFDTLLKE